MHAARETDVVVVGAGPAGLFQALALRERGIDVLVFDENSGTSSRSYALALHPGSLELFDRLGLSRRLLRAGRRIATVALYDDGGRRSEIRISDLAGEYPFVLVLPQSDLEDVLETRLQELDTPVQWDSRVQELEPHGTPHVRVARLETVYARPEDPFSAKRVVDQTFEIRAKFVIGADGYHSVVREALDLPCEPAGPDALFGVFEFQCDRAVGEELRVLLTSHGTSFYWPLAGRRCRWSFELEPSGDFRVQTAGARAAFQMGARSFRRGEAERLEQLLGERAPWFEGSPGEISWSTAVRFEPRLSTAFGKDRVWLAGDAARQTLPAGNQGMNVAFREGCDLAERIEESLAKGQSSEPLERFDRERIREWRHLLRLAPFLDPSNATDPWIATQADRILPCIPASGWRLRDLLGQLGIATLGALDGPEPAHTG